MASPLGGHSEPDQSGFTRDTCTEIADRQARQGRGIFPKEASLRPAKGDAVWTSPSIIAETEMPP